MSMRGCVRIRGGMRHVCVIERERERERKIATRKCQCGGARPGEEV